MTRFFGILALLLLALPGVASAQDVHGAYLTLNVDKAALQGEWRVRLLDLDPALELDTNRDGEITWQEIEHRRADIERLLHASLRIHANGADTNLSFRDLVYGAQNNVPFIRTQLSATAPADISTIAVDYSLLPDQHSDHSCQLKIIWRGQGTHAAEVSARSGILTFARESAASNGVLAQLRSGIWHIWTGYDHVLFLLVLLIPAVFQRTATGREAVPDFGGAFARVIVIVSAFTVAHSLTLTFAAMQWITLPSRLVESAIAASVFIAALLNFLPTTAGVRGAWLAFGFGLLHGFGFAGVLSETDMGDGPIWRTLLAFNAGVEIGQLVIVAAFLPIAYLLRNTRFYRTGVVYGGSSLAGLCALVWFWRRAF